MHRLYLLVNKVKDCFERHETEDYGLSKPCSMRQINDYGGLININNFERVPIIFKDMTHFEYYH